jgi:hypothetical protein
MASEVDICNLALGHLGDRATVSSINPPEGSAQAEHCARFYPIARDMVLESHEWGFATKRANLALLVDTPPPGFMFVYQQPSDCRNIIDLIDPHAPTFFPIDERCGHWQDDAFTLPAVPYELEARGDGVGVIYTNLENAIVRYTASVTDTTKFSAQVVDTIAWLLAAYLAGPVMKGDVGAAMASSCMKAYLISLGKATANDANNRRRSISQSQRPAPWIQNR